MERNVFELAASTEPGMVYCKVGKVHCFWFDENGSPRITVGPHWPLMVISLVLISVVSIVFVVYICPKVGVVNTILGVFGFAIVVSLYLITALMDPGVVLANMQMMAKGDFDVSVERKCLDCNITREEFTEHCRKCKVCVDELDSHYALIGKCVGRKTIKYFYALLISTLSILVFIVSTLFFRFKDQL